MCVCGIYLVKVNLMLAMMGTQVKSEILEQSSQEKMKMSTNSNEKRIDGSCIVQWNWYLKWLF